LSFIIDSLANPVHTHNIRDKQIIAVHK